MSYVLESSQRCQVICRNYKAAFIMWNWLLRISSSRATYAFVRLQSEAWNWKVVYSIHFFWKFPILYVSDKEIVERCKYSAYNFLTFSIGGKMYISISIYN